MLRVDGSKDASTQASIGGRVRSTTVIANIVETRKVKAKATQKETDSSQQTDASAVR